MTCPPARPRPYSVSGVFPALGALARLVPVLDGAERLVLVDLPRALQTGRPTPPTRALAERIRGGTGGAVEPRNVAGYWDVASRYGLLHEGAGHVLTLTRRGRSFVDEPLGRTRGLVALREGLLHLLAEVDGGRRDLAALLPGWRAVLDGNRRFASPASHSRGLGQRVAALVRDGWLTAHGDHAARLADEAGFRRREPEPAFADLGGGLALGAAGRSALAAWS